MSRPPASSVIANFVHSHPRAVADNDARVVRRALTEVIALALAARGEPIASRLDRYVEQTRWPGNATIWGTGQQVHPELAAFVNGTAAHALDYDDVASPLRGHPSVAMLPAVVAIAESDGLTGAEVVDAYAVGFEVICTLAPVLIEEHYVRGWHSTATIGAIGATCAIARLRRLTPEQTSAAIAMAMTQIAGSQVSFGTNAKPVQAGMANVTAIRSARLACSGLTGSAHALDGANGGFERLYTQTDSDRVSEVVSHLGDPPGSLTRYGLEIKRYPACYAAHRAIQAALELRELLPGGVSGIADVDVLTNRGGLVPLVHDDPADGTEARFSIQHAVATALLDGCVQLSSYRESSLQRKDLRDLQRRVRAREADGPMFPRWTELTITCASGAELRRRVDLLDSGAHRPPGDAEFRAKVTDCLRHGGRLSDSTRLIDAIADSDRVPVSTTLCHALETDHVPH